MLVLVAAVWTTAVGWATVAAVRAAAATEPAHPIVLLAQTRTACRVIGIDQAGEVARLRVVDLSGDALRCVLDGMAAPSYVWAQIVTTRSPGTRSTFEWEVPGGHRSADWVPQVRAEWVLDPVHGTDLTIRVLPEIPEQVPHG